MQPIIKTFSITLAVVVLAATVASAKIEDDIQQDLLIQGYAVGNKFALELKQSVKNDVQGYTQKRQFKEKKEAVKYVEGRLRRHAWNIYNHFRRAIHAMINTSCSDHPKAVRPTSAEKKKLIKVVGKKLYDETKQAIIHEVVTAHHLK
jgi:hypothetical protein